MATVKFSRRNIAKAIAAQLLATPSDTSKWMQMAAAYLVDSKQVNKAEQLVQDIAREIQLQSGTLLATVVSAHELSAELREQIAKSLARKTGAQDVNIDATVNPALLSGYMARTPDYEINTTAQHRLKQLKSLEA
jgi:F0F1-type ATP synthase delta subunit